jgi:hypothetical protein
MAECVEDESYSDSEDDIGLEELSPGEVRLYEEKKRLKAERAEQKARDQQVESCAATVILFDKGTRLGCELWDGSGLIVRHPACDRPCFLSTGDAIPDAYHAAHAVVFLSPGDSGSITVKLDAAHFFISTWKDPLIDDFPVEDKRSGRQANYCIVSLQDSPLPPHVAPLDLVANSALVVSHGDPLLVVQAPRTPEANSLVRLTGLVQRVKAGAITFASDPMTDGALRPGCPVFARAGGSPESNLELAGIHLGHQSDVLARSTSEEEERKVGVEFYSHGFWQHTILDMGTILRHYNNAVVVLNQRANVAQRELEAFVGKGNARRERIQECTEMLRLILANPDKPPPEVFEAEDAKSLSLLALGRGYEVVLTLLRVYRDGAVQRFALEALAKALTSGTEGCSPASVAVGGGCELVSLSLQRYSVDPDLVAAACWCVTLLAEASDVSRRFLRCDGSSAMVSALRRNCEHGSSHVGAQRWGLSAISVLARNGMHRERMFSEGVSEVLPLMISNDPNVLEDLDLQLWGLHAIIELCSGPSAESAGEALLEAGVMDALLKVRKLSPGSVLAWKELSTIVFDELDWEK